MDAQRVERKLMAILAADVVGYSRLMGVDEAGTLAQLKAHRSDLIDPTIAAHHGRIVKTAGDGMLVAFPSVVDAVRCAVEVQREMAARNADLPEDRRMLFRVGINLGDVIIDGDDIHGDGVNVAARLESLCEAGGVCISRSVYDQVRNRLELDHEYLGEQEVKNIAEPVRAYRTLLHRAEEPREETADAPAPALGLPDNPSIAVLPFDNMSADPEQEFFADGITEDLITALSKISGLFVIARNSTFAYKGKSPDVRHVAQDLGVRYVLEGSVRKAGERVRITGQLIDSVTGYHAWAERYDRDLTDIFALQDEITTNVVTALQVQLVEGEQARVWRRLTDNIEAWGCLTQARVHFRRYTREENVKARELSQRAVELDPSYAPAWVWLAWTYWTELRFGWTDSPDEAFARAAELGHKALSLNESLSESHALLGAIHLIKGQYDEAIAEGERAVSLDPNGADVTALLAMTLNWAGRPQEAIGLVEKAMRLSPLYSAWYLAVLGHAYRLMRRYEEAIATYEASIQRNPDNVGPHLGLTATYAEAGREGQAQAQAAEVLRLNPKFSLNRYASALTYRDPANSRRSLDALRKAGLPE